MIDEPTELATYRTFRQFPLLHTSIREIGYVLDEKRSFKNSKQPLKSTGRIIAPRPTSNPLKELTRSCLPHINQLSTFRNEVLTNHFRHNPTPAADTHSSTKLSKDPFERAKEKLTRLSLSFDSKSSFNIMSGFADKYMSNVYFKSQIKHCLFISLTADEEESLFAYFLRVGSDTIDGADFSRFLLKLGSEARQKLRDELVKKRNEEVIERKSAQMEESARRRAYEDEHVTFRYSAEDTSTMLHKLSEAALKFEEQSDIAKLGFGAFLSPYEFKVQVEKTFGIKLSSEEAGAMTDYFKKETELYVDGIAFGKKFGRIRADAWRRHSLVQREIAKKTLKLRKMGQNVENYTQCLGR